MDLEVGFNKTNNKEEAYEAVKNAITPELLEKFKVKADIAYNMDNIQATGKGFTLDMNFMDEKVGLTVKLSLILKPLKGTILDSLEKQIKRVV